MSHDAHCPSRDGIAFCACFIIGTLRRDIDANIRSLLITPPMCASDHTWNNAIRSASNTGNGSRSGSS